MRAKARIFLLFVVFGGALAGCTTVPRKTPPTWVDAPTEAALKALLCRLDDDCRWLRFRLYDSDQPLAEIRYGFEIVLSRGMLERTVDDHERAFLLAHELAHRRLDHRPPRRAAERLPLELAADAWAAQRLSEVGLDSAAGGRLLHRLHDELAASQANAPRRAQALSEFAARIAALR